MYPFQYCVCNCVVKKSHGWQKCPGSECLLWFSLLNEIFCLQNGRDWPLLFWIGLLRTAMVSHKPSLSLQCFTIIAYRYCMYILDLQACIHLTPQSDAVSRYRKRACRAVYREWYTLLCRLPTKGGEMEMQLHTVCTNCWLWTGMLQNGKQPFSLLQSVIDDS